MSLSSNAVGKQTRRHVRMAPIDKLFHVLVIIFLLFVGVIIVLPLLHVFAQSLSDPMAIISGKVTFWPVRPTLEIYKNVIQSPNIRQGFLNTLLYAGGGTAINLVMTILCAYPLSRKNIYGKGFLMFLFSFTMMFGGGMIPTYLNIKSLGLLDSRWVMVLPSAMTVWNMVLCRTFFMSIPEEIYEAAGLDGSSDIHTLLVIVLPLSTSIIAVMMLFYAVGHWNSYFDAMMYLSSQSKYNIQLVLRNAISNINTIMNSTQDMANLDKNQARSEAVKYVVIVVTMIPVMVIYPFAQKYFVKGVMIGSLKG